MKTHSRSHRSGRADFVKELTPYEVINVLEFPNAYKLQSGAARPPRLDPGTEIQIGRGTENFQRNTKLIPTNTFRFFAGLMASNLDTLQGWMPT